MSRSASEATKTANQIIDVLQKISGALDRIRFFKREGQSIYIKTQQKIVQYDAAIRVRQSGVISKDIEFPLPQVKCINGTCMPSLLQLGNSIKRRPTGFVLSLEDIPLGTELVLLQFQYKIPDPRFIANLVETRVATEPLEFKDKDEYWMSAQLRFPKVLEKVYSGLEIEDIDLNVNVAVDNEIKTAIPWAIRKDLQIIREMLSEPERGKAHRLLLNHMQMRKRLSMDIYGIITEISTLFSPLRFQSFVEITSPFRYFNSKQGTSFSDFAGQLVPKMMTVISSADLNLQLPAVSGKVIYKKKDMLDTLRCLQISMSRLESKFLHLFFSLFLYHSMLIFLREIINVYLIALSL